MSKSTNTVKYTPGPWQGSIWSTTADVMISRSDRATQIADHWLIAAASDLLEALKLVADSGKFACFDDAAWDVVNAAISKATGSPAPQEKGM